MNALVQQILAEEQLCGECVLQGDDKYVRQERILIKAKVWMIHLRKTTCPSSIKHLLSLLNLVSELKYKKNYVYNCLNRKILKVLLISHWPYTYR